MTRRSTLTRRSALLAPLLASPFLATAWRDAAAQDYPAGTIRIIAPGPAGSPRDLRARWAAEQLGPALDRPVVVDNKPGAGGNIGMEAAAKSAPDGRTLVIVDTGTLTQNPHIYQRPGYDARADFAWIGARGPVAEMPVLRPRRGGHGQPDDTAECSQSVSHGSTARATVSDYASATGRPVLIDS